MTSTTTDFETGIRELIALGDLDGALGFIRFLVDHVRFDPAATGVTLGSPALDRLCGEIGAASLPHARAMARQTSAPASHGESAEVIIFATELYAIGGHSRIIADLIATRPDKRHLLLLSNFFETGDENIAKQFASGLASGTPLQLLSAPVAGRLEKLVWLQAELARHPAAQVILFNHHADAAAIAAIQPGLNREVVFYHHADYHLCLGVHLDWTHHVDFFPPCLHRCTEAGIHAEYWPLSAPDRGVRNQAVASFCRNNQTVTCTSGVWSKFDEDYPFRYVEVAADILQATRGKHIHIGGMPDEALARIHTNLAARGIAAERFEHIPKVPSVWDTLIACGVDVYIGSFPLGGGRAMTEALGAGVPIITHRHRLEPLLGACGVGPAGTWTWGTPEELCAILQQLTPEIVAQHSRDARTHYLLHHSPEIFRRCVQDGVSPALPVHTPQGGDRLVSYLMRSTIRSESHQPVLEQLALRVQAAREGKLTSHPSASQAPGSLAAAIALYEHGDLEAAYAAFAALLEQQPEEPQILVHLGLIALRAGLVDDARNFFDHAAARSQDAANTQAAIGQRCLALNHAALAEHYLQEAIRRTPSMIGAWALLADTLAQQGDPARALHLLKPMMQAGASPHPEILLRIIRLANTTQDVDTELTACLQARSYADCHSRALRLMSQRTDTTPARLLEETRDWVSMHANVAASRLPAGPRKRLRIGFVPGSIARDETNRRLEILLCALDPAHFETLLFFHEVQDTTTAQRLALIVDESHSLAGMDAASAAQAVQARATDVLLLLDWHANPGSMLLFAQRAAPVQINFTAPPRSSALANMDYIFTSTSANRDDFTEAVLSLPPDAGDPAKHIGEALLAVWQQQAGSTGAAA